jgi:catechol 2,3-dioxygenase-like lactoylglutathione lyase family enzyme
VPIDHVKLPISDLDASRAFYAAALAPFGYRLCTTRIPASVSGRGDGSNENEPFDLLRVGRPSIPSHVAITATSTEEVDAFYEAAMAAGGQADGPPGERPYGGFYDAAFVLDPDSQPSTTTIASDRV